MSGAVRRGSLVELYAREVLERIEAVAEEQRSQIDAAAQIAAGAMAADGLVYLFGTGHSHVLGEEAFYRAGGLARVCPILVAPYMLHEGAVRSTVLERERGHADEILAGYRLDGERDCLVVASNSGVNALPIEVAERARAIGLPIVAITSVAYGASIPEAPARLTDLADVVLDNRCPPGDALVPLGDGLPAMGPGSTIVGAFLLNSVLLGAAEALLADGRTPDVFRSANMPGAREHNAALVAALQDRVPHL